MELDAAEGFNLEKKSALEMLITSELVLLKVIF
jgi:hypothetical protein